MRFDLDNNVMLEMREAFFSKLYDGTQINEYTEIWKIVKIYDVDKDVYDTRWDPFAYITTYDKKLQSVARVQVKISIKTLIAFNKMLKDMQDWDINKYFKDNYRK